MNTSCRHEGAKNCEIVTRNNRTKQATKLQLMLLFSQPTKKAEDNFLEGGNSSVALIDGRLMFRCILINSAVDIRQDN
jgi:hypothetical protein